MILDFHKTSSHCATIVCPTPFLVLLRRLHSLMMNLQRQKQIPYSKKSSATWSCQFGTRCVGGIRAQVLYPATLHIVVLFGLPMLSFQPIFSTLPVRLLETPNAAKCYSCCSIWFLVWLHERWPLVVHKIDVIRMIIDSCALYEAERGHLTRFVRFA